MSLMEEISSARVYLDGAMGSELIARGLDTGEGETYNLTRPEVVLDIHRSYAAAGSRVLYANTFGANARKLAGSGYSVAEVAGAGIALARRAAAGKAYVAYDAGPIGELLQPYGRLSLEECYRLYAEQAEAARGADCVVIETITDTAELRQAILAFRERTDLPIFCSMSFTDSGRTFSGCTVEAFTHIAESLGASMVGVNCSFGAADMLRFAERLAACASVPVFVKPNAGIPVLRDGKTVYDANPIEFAEQMKAVAELGIPVLGGCCGTTPEYIRALVAATKDYPVKRFFNPVPRVCSGRGVVDFSSPRVVGERLNPTGKPRLKRALLEDDYDYLAEVAAEQTEAGAELLDVNAGIGGIDEAAKLSAAVRRVQESVDAPLMIDTSRPEAAEAALRAANGVCILNSVNAGADSLSAMLPIAKKYGAYLVGLCLDGEGIPETAKGRLERAERVVLAADREGIARGRLLIDPLTLSVSVREDNAVVTLEALRLIKRELGVKTVLGLSNVSFGLPQRERLNAAFYRMALDAGLDAAIVNPALRPASDPLADAVLRGEDPGCAAYLAHCGSLPEASAQPEAVGIFDCIVRGRKSCAAAAAERAANRENYAEVIDGQIIPALNRLGELYEQGKAFLPQLMGGAEAARLMLEYIADRFQKGEEPQGELMLLATVRGDVHDIGKNIVKAVLCNYGYRIVDLGKDVPVERLAEETLRLRPRYVGLSALMTTTLDNMRLSVQAIKAAAPDTVVIVGGAVVTQEFAESIGADLYASSAQDAVNKLKSR